MITRLFLTLLLPIFLSAEVIGVSQLFNVKTVLPKLETSALSQQFFGYSAVDESRVVDISPRFGGFVEVLYADKHFKRVKKGEALAKVYSPEVLQAKEEYINSYHYNSTRSAKAMVSSAKQKLHLLGVNDLEIENISKKKKANSYTTIVSPIDGYVFIKNINKGSAFKTGTKLFEIVNLDIIWIEAKIYTSHISKVDSFTNFKVKLDGFTDPINAKVEKLIEKVNPKEAIATLRLQVENKNNAIFPGLYAKVEARTDVNKFLTLPRTAVMRKNSQFYVFKAGEYEGEYEPSVVEVKPLNAKKYILLSGLAEDERVVNNALFLMDSDAQVNGLY